MIDYISIIEVEPHVKFIGLRLGLFHLDVSVNYQHLKKQSPFPCRDQDVPLQRSTPTGILLVSVGLS